MATQLSPNFTLEGLLHSDYALRHDADNSTSDPSILAALTTLAVKILSRSALSSGRSSRAAGIAVQS
jgi:hypothetical protein